MARHHACAFPEDLFYLIRDRLPVQTSGFHGNQIEHIVFRPGRDCDAGMSHVPDVMNQHVGLIASWNEFREEDAARFHLLDQFLNRLLKSANWARAIRKYRIAGDSPEGKD